MENEQIQKIYAHIVEEKVVNVSVWTSEPVGELNEQFVEIPEGLSAGIGWDYKDKKFVDNRKPELPTE
jgi:hypothetical protein